MRLPGYLIAFVLMLLLAATTPVGTGTGLHQFDLLHPLFSHVHVVNGRVMSHEQMAFEALGTPAPRPAWPSARVAAQAPTTSAWGEPDAAAARDDGREGRAVQVGRR